MKCHWIACGGLLHQNSDEQISIHVIVSCCQDFHRIVFLNQCQSHLSRLYCWGHQNSNLLFYQWNATFWNSVYQSLHHRHLFRLILILRVFGCIFLKSAHLQYPYHFVRTYLTELLARTLTSQTSWNLHQFVPVHYCCLSLSSWSFE